MAFSELSEKPDISTMHDPETGEKLIVAPSLQFFKDEIMFWRTQRDKADKEGAATLRTMAAQNIKGLQKIVVGRSAAEEMCLGLSSYNTEEIGSWYARGVLFMANIRLMHEIIELPNLKLGSFAATIARNGVCIDFNEKEAGKSGLHVVRDFMRKEIRLEPPVSKKEKWFEGETIFVNAAKPAAPTTVFKVKYKKHFGEEFNKDGFISLVPRLKTSYWPTA